MTYEQMEKRVAELRDLARQHETALLQIAGIIGEYQRLLADKPEVDEQSGDNHAPHQE